jgi:integrase
MEIKVSIYERAKTAGKWREIPMRVPRIIKKDGSLFAKDDRQGKFIISWCENRKKKRQAVKADGGLPWLSDAVALAKSKAWYLDSRKTHPVSDPTTAPARPEIYGQIPLYLDAKSGCAKTLSAHRLALREFAGYAAGQHIAYVDEIAKPHMHKFYDELVGGGNTPFTAARKILKVNSFYRAVMKLDAGRGVITKRDYKRELTTSRTPEVYSRQELDALFAHMDGYENLVFSVFLGAALRKKELQHLEDADLIRDEMVPGKWKCELRIESKPQWGHMTKTGATRNVLIPKELMDRLQERKLSSRPSSLLFGTGRGKPDSQILRRLKKIAERAGIDPAKCTDKKFRATAATGWLRSKELGGKGWDIGFVRQQLGHADLQSIEHYITLVKNSEMAMREGGV